MPTTVPICGMPTLPGTAVSQDALTVTPDEFSLNPYPKPRGLFIPFLLKKSLTFCSKSTSSFVPPIPTVLINEISALPIFDYSLSFLKSNQPVHNDLIFRSKLCHQWIQGSKKVMLLSPYHSKKEDDT